MTTRRSRLKAVANLPIRRKIPALQEASEELLLTSNATENDNSINTKSDQNSENYSNTKNTCNVGELQKCSTVELFSADASIENSVCNTDNLGCNNELPVVESTVKVYTKLGGYNVNHGEKNTNEMNENIYNMKNNKISSKSTPTRYTKHFKPNLASFVPKEKGHSLGFEKKESHCNIVKQNVISSGKNTDLSTRLEESVSTIAVPTPDNIRTPSIYQSQNFTKKLADAKREFQKKYEKSKPDRSTLKMIDLIFYNPTTNPMESKNKCEKKDNTFQDGLIQEMLTEEEIDEPQALIYNSNIQSSGIDEIKGMNGMPVPQVKVGRNGEIIIDEKSIIIETTEAKKGREDLMNSVPIFEDRTSKVSYYRGKTRKTRDWTDFETKRFYKALNTIGPDFSLMQKYFPKRSRLELKNKFKREERFNRNLIDTALINPSEFDMTLLEEDLAFEKIAEERETEMKLNKGIKEKAAVKRPRGKSSLFSREIIEINEASENSRLKITDIPTKASFQNENDKKKKELGLIFQKFVLNEFEEEITEPTEEISRSYIVL